MTVVREEQRVVSTVGVNDRYRVEVQQSSRTEEYTPDEAKQFAADLIAASVAARRLLDERTADVEVVHLGPESGEDAMLCCGRSPFDVGRFDRITWDAAAMTCGRAERSTATHGFDLAAPMCRECQEGKHGTCNGTALVDLGPFVQTYECGSAAVQHDVMGAAS